MRKLYLLILINFCLVLSSTVSAQPDNMAIRSLADPELRPFYHGVASGDPTSSSVIIWTRVTPEIDAPVMVRWRVGTDTTLNSLVAQGTFTTDASRDYTVKVDVTGLNPNSYYYYEFSALDANSVIGRTKTTPNGSVDQLRFAVVSCSNYPTGYFNVYEKIYERNDVDAVLHLGDYIYEGGGSSILSEDMPRSPLPDHEIIVLGDYRLRHSSHKLDSDSRKMHQNFPLIAVWDDHESANNSWRDGAENHSEGAEGTWVDRKAASLQAYYEWMPLRLPDETNFERIFRKISYGDLADIYMIDTRLYDRDEQSLPGQYTNPERTLIGEEQMTWLQTEMINSTAQYQVVGQQVVMGPWVIPNYVTQEFLALNNDAWDGYAAERTRLYDFVLEANIENLVVLTGDVHTGWAMDLPYDIFNYNGNNGAGSVGVEFVCNSVTSNSLPVPFPLGEALIPVLLPWVKYVELTIKGYVVLDLSAEKAQGDFYTLGSITQPTSNETWASGWFARDGNPHLERTFTRSTDGRPTQDLAPCEPRDIADTVVTAVYETFEFDVLGIYPNPFINDLLLEVHLFEDQEVQLSLIDTKGAFVVVKDYGHLSMGRNLITLHDLDLPSGIYEVLLQVGDLSVSRSIVRME